jgi:transketolase
VLDRTLAAVEDLDLTVLYATTVAPFDEETLRNALVEAAPDVILIEPYYEGGLVQDISRALRNIPTRIEAIGVPRRVLERYGPPERLDREVGLTVDGIRTRITRLLQMPRPLSL